MDTENDVCPHCGSAQLKSSLICGMCGRELKVPVEEATRLPQSRGPGYLQRRQLIASLVVGGVGLVALGSCIGTVLLREQGGLSTILSAPANVPMDKHRVLTFPFLEAELTDYVWLPDNTHLLGFDSQTLFLLDVKRGKKDWVQSRLFPPRGQQGQILWSSKRRYVAEVGNVGSAPHDEYRAVVWDLLSRQPVWKSPLLGHLGNTFDPCVFAPSGASSALCQDTGDINDSDSDNIAQIWDLQQNRVIKDWPVQEPGQTGDFAVTSMAWSLDTTRLVVICSGGSVQLWDVASGSRLWTYAIANGRGTSVQWSPDGTTLALWGTHTDTPITILVAHHVGVCAETCKHYSEGRG